MSGPDLTITAGFRSSASGGLAAAVRRFPFQHFAHHAVSQQFCRQHMQLCSYDLYVDTRNGQQLVANIEGHQALNIWLYHCIEVCQNALMIERGYGGYGKPYTAEEHALLRWLIGLPQLELQRWQAATGGDGYAGTTLADGSSGGQLLAYLATAPGEE